MAEFIQETNYPCWIYIRRQLIHLRWFSLLERITRLDINSMFWLTMWPNIVFSWLIHPSARLGDRLTDESVENEFSHNSKHQKYLDELAVLGRQITRLRHNLSPLESYLTKFNTGRLHPEVQPLTLFSAECTIGMVWGLTLLTHYGNKAIRQ